MQVITSCCHGSDVMPKKKKTFILQQIRCISTFVPLMKCVFAKQENVRNEEEITSVYMAERSLWYEKILVCHHDINSMTKI